MSRSHICHVCFWTRGKLLRKTPVRISRKFHGFNFLPCVCRTVSSFPSANLSCRPLPSLQQCFFSDTALTLGNFLVFGPLVSDAQWRQATRQRSIDHGNKIPPIGHSLIDRPDPLQPSSGLNTPIPVLLACMYVRSSYPGTIRLIRTETYELTYTSTIDFPIHPRRQW